jgi:hypothetical protein
MTKHDKIAKAVAEYATKIKADSVVLFIAHSPSEGIALTSLIGSENTLTALMANEDGYITFKDKDKSENYEDIQKAILNSAINILRTNKQWHETFTKKLWEL